VLDQLSGDDGPVSGLEMRPNCECCDADLPADEPGAVVCSFECTYCAGCAEHLDRTCPTCGGALMPRPTRVGDALARHPAATERVVGERACPGPGYLGRAAPVERLTRKPERGTGERAELDALLDEVLAGTLSTVVDGRPWVVPMLFARDGDEILLHGSTGAGALRQVAAGAPAALTVMALDGLVVAHTTFDSSANYRSAVVHGELRTLDDGQRARALDVLSERLVPGRTREVRPMTRREQVATLAMALPITDGRWLLKARSGGPGEPEEATAAWSGVVPFRTVAGAPEPAPWSAAAGTEVPASVRALVDRWPT
jgi:nitroimidazol reductase NimA-like FMN-containing flavoprotein (pyridoxamine 5'-phosphate oxidase superfamily)